MEHLLQLFHPLIKHSRSVFVALSCGCPRVLSSLSNSSLMSTTLLHVTCRRNKKQCFGHAKKNHERLGNDADISHATVQRAALQPGPDED